MWQPDSGKPRQPGRKTIRRVEVHHH
jgi:hypothetical protein